MAYGSAIAVRPRCFQTVQDCMPVENAARFFHQDYGLQLESSIVLPLAIPAARLIASHPFPRLRVGCLRLERSGNRFDIVV